MHLSTKNLPEHEVHRFPDGEEVAWEDMMDNEPILVDDGEAENLRDTKEQYQENLRHAKDWTEAIYWQEKIIEVEGVAADNGYFI